MTPVKTISSQNMKDANMLAVFDVIRKNEGIARLNIAKTTNLSPSTVTVITEELLSSEVILESKHEEIELRRGRKAVGLYLNTRKYFILTLEVQYGDIIGAVFDLALNEVYRITRSFEHIEENFAENIIAVVRKLIEMNKEKNCIYLGIGIGMHGLVEKHNGFLVTSTKLGLIRIKIHDVITNTFNIPVYFDNIANFAGLIEKNQFVKPLKSFVYIYVGRGIGSCVINEKSISGCLGAIPEIGHISIDHCGRKCSCGNLGCLELYLSVNSIISEAVSRINESTQILKLVNNDTSQIDLNVIYTAAKAGDSLALEIISYTARSLGCALVSVVNIFNPEVIVIGGRIVSLRELFLDEVCNVTLNRAIKPFCENLSIKYSSYSEPPIIDGAAAAVLDAQIPNLILNNTKR